MSAYGLVACQECGAATQACIQPCNLCQSFAGQLQPPAERPRLDADMVLDAINRPSVVIKNTTCPKCGAGLNSLHLSDHMALAHGGKGDAQ